MDRLPPRLRSVAAPGEAGDAGSTLSADDLAILGEAASILARIQASAGADARAGEVAGLGRITIQLVLTDALMRVEGDGALA